MGNKFTEVFDGHNGEFNLITNINVICLIYADWVILHKEVEGDFGNVE